MSSMSIRARLTLWSAASSGAVLVALGIAVLVTERAVLHRAAQRSLERDLAAVLAEIGSDPSALDRPADLGLSEAYAVWSGEELLHASPGWRHFGLPAIAGEAGIRRVGDRECRVLYGEVPGRPWRLAVAHDETRSAEAIDLLGKVLAAASPIALFGALGVGWFVAGRALQPVRQLRRDLERISADRLGDRVRVGRPADEFGRLSLVLNRMLERLQRAMVAQRRFAADASHQLRTPLTAQRAIGESALTRHSDDAGRLADAIASMLEEADRLTAMTSALLEIARTENSTRRRQPLDLGTAVAEIVDRVEPLIETAGHRLRTRCEAVTVLADRESLDRALTGVLENAIVHCTEPCDIEVVVRQDGDEAVIEVADGGPGIREEEAEAIFEPFRRGAEAVTRPGSGLGLPLARAAARAAGGSLRLASREPATFRFAFPLHRA